MFNRIKTFFKGKRIIEVNGKFIPQIRVKRDDWIFSWEWHGIAATEYSERTEYRLHEPWYEQTGKCQTPTKDKAALHL